MKKNIYLSAPGLICCAGQNRDALYESCLNGYQGGMVMRNFFGNGQFPVGLIPGKMPAAVFHEVPALPPAVQNTRIIRMMNTALEQIRPDIEKALSAYGPAKIGVCLGSCDNGSEASLAAHQALLANGAFPEDYDLWYQSAAFPAEFIARKFGLAGPVFTVATACASGASAIMRGAQLIQAGMCSAVIAGGADIVSPTVMAGFHALEALSDSLCNPFSKNRKGINLGEGAAFFLLDTAECSAITLAGAGESADAYHMTAPGTDGAGPAKAMKAALFDAGIKPEAVEYVNLHGTGTVLNDRAESLAMRTVFAPTVSSPTAQAPPASSTKPITGHTLGAAGALEAAICWMALNEQKGLPLHCWDGVRDEDIPFFHPVSDSNSAAPSICMSNSFAFGGSNVSLILERR